MAPSIALGMHRDTARVALSCRTRYLTCRLRLDVSGAGMLDSRGTLRTYYVVICSLLRMQPAAGAALLGFTPIVLD